MDGPKATFEQSSSNDMAAARQLPACTMASSLEPVTTVISPIEERSARSARVFLYLMVLVQASRATAFAGAAGI